jgi:hypothetical protein
LTKKIEKRFLGIGVAARAKSVKHFKGNETKRTRQIGFRYDPKKNDDSSTFVASVEDDFSKVLFSYF